MHQWSTTPINNQSADARAYLVEGSTPVSGINNAIRGAMATAALWRDDNLGVSLVAAGGAGNAYTVSTGQGLIDPTTQVGGATPAITHPFSLRITFSAAPTGMATNPLKIAIDGAAAATVTKADGSALVDGDVKVGKSYEIVGTTFSAGALTQIRLLGTVPSDYASAASSAQATANAALAAAQDAQNNRISSMRFIYAGTQGNDVGSSNSPSFPSTYGGYAVVVDRWTAPAPNQAGGNAIVNLLYRYLQMYIPSQGWVTVGAAS